MWLILFLPVHTLLYSPFMSSILSHPTYIFIVEEELLIPSRPLPGYLRCNSMEWAVKVDSFCRGLGCRHCGLWFSSQLPGQIARTTPHRGSYTSSPAINTIITSLQVPNFSLLFLTTSTSECSSLCVAFVWPLNKSYVYDQCTRPSSLFFHSISPPSSRLTLI